MRRLINNIIQLEKIVLLLIIILISFIGFTQQSCQGVPIDYSGKCESYDNEQGYRSSWTYNNGLLHGPFDQSYANGQLRSKGKYRDGMLDKKFISYYDSGESLTVGKFKIGTGDFTMYHKNGEKKMTGSFINGTPTRIWLEFNEKGEFTDSLKSNQSEGNDMIGYLLGELELRSSSFDLFNGMFDLDNFFSSDIDSVFSELEEQIKAAMQRFQERFESKNYDTTFHFNFSDSSSNFEHFEFFHGDTAIDIGHNSGLIDFPDVEPSFPGGNVRRDEFIRVEMNYPLKSKENHKEATIFIEVIISMDGELVQPQIALGGERELELEALRIVRVMPNWIPAEHQGRAVKTRVIIPIQFSLHD